MVPPGSGKSASCSIGTIGRNISLLTATPSSSLNPRGSTAYGATFQKALQDDVGGGEAQDLISGAEAMVERGIADGDRLGIGGWSWGGYLTARTVTVTNIFKAAVMGAGLSNIVSDHGQDDIPQRQPALLPRPALRPDGRLLGGLAHPRDSRAAPPRP